MKKNLEAQHKELEEKRRVFEEERANWEALQRQEQLKQEASKYEQLSPLTRGPGFDFKAVYSHWTQAKNTQFSSLCVPHSTN